MCYQHSWFYFEFFFYQWSLVGQHHPCVWLWSSPWKIPLERADPFLFCQNPWSSLCPFPLGRDQLLPSLLQPKTKVDKNDRGLAGLQMTSQQSPPSKLQTVITTEPHIWRNSHLLVLSPFLINCFDLKQLELQYFRHQVTWDLLSSIQQHFSSLHNLNIQKIWHTTTK